MKRFLTIFLVGIAIVTLFAVIATAQSEDEIQVTLKSKNLGPDPAWGGSRATITITTNKIGDLTYVEEYYGVGGDGKPKFFNGNRHEEVMKDYTTSFDLIRPDHDHKQSWSMIKSKVIFDKVMVYEVWINTSGTYRSFTGRAGWFNNSTIEIGKGRPTIQKKEPFDPMNNLAKVSESNVEDNLEDNSVNSDNSSTSVRSPMLEGYAIIGTVLFVYIFSRKKR